MTPLDSRNLQRLDSTLADIERAIDVSRVHVASGCPDAAQRELAQASLSIGHARRIAQGPARDAIPDAESRQLLEEIPDNIPTDRWPEEHLDPSRHAGGRDD